MSAFDPWVLKAEEDRLATKQKRLGVHTCPLFRCNCKTDEECKKKGCWCCKHNAPIHIENNLPSRSFPKCPVCGREYRSADYVARFRIENHLEKIHGWSMQDAMRWEESGK